MSIRSRLFKMEKVFVYFIVLMVFKVTVEATLTNVAISDAFTEGLDNYYDKQTLIPVKFTNETLNVTIDISLAALNDFNELGGYLEISGYLQVGWNEDNSVMKNKCNVSVLLPSRAVWKPPLILVNSMMGTAEIGDTTSKIRCNLLSWDCVWKPWIVFRGACVPDVKFYPFDRQECSFKIAAWGHTKDELKLISTRQEWNFDLYEENAEWVIQETGSETYDQYNVSYVEFKIKLKRIPTYYIISLIAPVTLLSLVSGFVFILPRESGERIGFSITCFLSFVVFLNTIMGFIPSSSVNIAYICYFVFMMMVFSCGMSLATIFTLWIHFKSENNNSRVPAVLYWLVFMLTCGCCNTKPRKPKNVIDVKPIHAESKRVERQFDPNYVDDVSGQIKVTWKDASSVMDKFFLLGFLGAQIFYSVTFLLPIILNE